LEGLERLIEAQNSILISTGQVTEEVEFTSAIKKEGYHGCLADSLHIIRIPSVDLNFFKANGRSSNDYCFVPTYKAGQTFQVTTRPGIFLCDQNGRTFFSYAALTLGENSVELIDTLHGYNPPKIPQGAFYQLRAPLLGKDILVRFDGARSSGYAAFSINIPDVSPSICIQ